MKKIIDIFYHFTDDLSRIIEKIVLKLWSLICSTIFLNFIKLLQQATTYMCNVHSIHLHEVRKRHLFKFHKNKQSSIHIRRLHVDLYARFNVDNSFVDENRTIMRICLFIFLILGYFKNSVYIQCNYRLTYSGDI